MNLHDIYYPNGNASLGSMMGLLGHPVTEGDIEDVLNANATVCE